MVNLLPPPVKASVIRAYYLRLGALTLLLISLALLVGGLLLLPSYFLAQASAENGERYLVALEETVGLKERAGAGATMSALAERVRILKEYAGTPMTTSLVDTVVGAKPKSVSINRISWEASTATVKVSGTAATRDALLAYVAALEESPLLSGVVLPLSQLASDRTIPFSISATYTPTP